MKSIKSSSGVYFKCSQCGDIQFPIEDIDKVVIGGID